MIFQNGDLGLRKMGDDADDLLKMQQWCSEMHVMDTYSERVWTLEEIREKFGKRIRSESSLTPAFIVYKGRDIGYLQFYPTDEEEYDIRGTFSLSPYNKPYAIDLFIGEESLLGKGIGTRIVRDTADYLFREIGADVVLIDPKTDNLRAINCYRRAGFQDVMILKERELFRGTYRDNLLMKKEMQK